jgi:hypothetical protein
MALHECGQRNRTKLQLELLRSPSLSGDELASSIRVLSDQMEQDPCDTASLSRIGDTDARKTKTACRALKLTIDGRAALVVAKHAHNIIQQRILRVLQSDLQHMC